MKKELINGRGIANEVEKHNIVMRNVLFFKFRSREGVRREANDGVREIETGQMGAEGEKMPASTQCKNHHRRYTRSMAKQKSDCFRGGERRGHSNRSAEKEEWGSTAEEGKCQGERTGERGSRPDPRRLEIKNWRKSRNEARGCIPNG